MLALKAPLPPMNNTRSPIKSSQRTLAILEYFNMRRSPATVGEIAGALSLPQSSTSMLLKGLLELGYLSYVAESRSYWPTFRASLLGNCAQYDGGYGASLITAMVDMASTLRETILLSVRRRSSVQLIHVEHGEEIIRYAARPGGRLPLSACAAGRLLLSGLSETEVRSIVRRNNASSKMSTSTRVSEAALLAELPRIRDQGFSESPRLIFPHVNNISMRLPTAPGQESITIGVGGEAYRIADKRAAIMAALANTVNLLRTDVRDRN